MFWNETNIQRIVLDMAAQIQRTSVGAVSGSPTRPLDLNHDLGLDSLSRMTLAAQVNDFFGLFHTSLENYLLSDSVLENWVRKIGRARQEHDREVVFLTSGTSGNPKRVRHSMNFLLREARFIQELLPRPTQVISTVPSNHLYGFLYTVVLPALWEVPLLTLAEVNAATLTANSLLIGTPFTWEYLYRTFASSGTLACNGVSSTAPLSASLFSKLTEAGVDVLDVYGSTDTGGIAFRRDPGAPFTLFPHVRLLGDPVSSVAVLGNEELLAIPDRIERVSESEIRVFGRRDGAIQIAGVNVVPADVQKIIGGCPLVAECDVYAKGVEGQPQLFCAIRLRHRSDVTETACANWLKEHLSAPEVPHNTQFY